MAAPLGIQNAKGHRGNSHNQSADGSMASRRGRQRQKKFETKEAKPGTTTGGQRAGSAHEALPHTPPGAKLPETPGPLSLNPEHRERKESVKGSQAAQKPRALDKFLPFQPLHWDEGKGAYGNDGAHHLPLVGPEKMEWYGIVKTP